MAGRPIKSSSPAKSKTGLIFLFVGIIFLGLVIFLTGLLGTYWFFIRQENVLSDHNALIGELEIVVNQAPVNEAQIPLNQSVTVQVLVSDSLGIARIEFWVNEQKIDQVSNSLNQQVPSMAAVFRWVPDSTGFYILKVKAYNQTGLSKTVEIAKVTALDYSNTPLPEPLAAPTPTITPLTPLATPVPNPTTELSSPLSTPTPTVATLVVNIATLNVRSGPGLSHEIVGQLLQASQIEITGQTNNTEQWWQIAFASAPAGYGWVLGNSSSVTVYNVNQVPTITLSPPPTLTPRPLPALSPTPTPSPTEIIPEVTIIRAPAGKTLLIAGNRSLDNHPALLTLSGGKSVGGGQEFDIAPGTETEIVLEPDFYRALWSSPLPGGFAYGSEFTAEVGKVMVMWVIPENNQAEIEIYDHLELHTESPPPTATINPTPLSTLAGPTASPGKALFLAGNRSATNQFAVLTLSGGNFGGGQAFTLDANTETSLELLPAQYRAIWTSPARGGFTAGRDFTVSTGQVIHSWIIPEDGQVFMQFPGQPPIQINN